MASSPSRPSLPLRRQTSARNLKQPEHDDLTNSLNQLSISTSPARRTPIRLSSAPASPFRPTGRRTSQSPAPNVGPSSRSPSQGRDPSLGAPTLLRKASMNSLRSSNGIGPGSTASRRSSMAHLMSPTGAKTPLSSTPILEKPRPTATSIARNTLRDELHVHHGSTPTRPTHMIVVLNDAVYGHRFSRPRTSRSALSTIVERPERVKAAVLGISAAYVRLGGRHCEGEYPLHPNREAEHITGIPFRIHKTERSLSLLSPAVVNVHGTKWMEELKMMCDAAESKLAMGGKELQRPQANKGTDKSSEKFHEGDLYLCSESLSAMEGALGAVCEAIDTVFGSGPRRAFVGVRPPGHHCSASYPSGFCWVNNVHVGIMHAALEHGLTHAAIIDFDLHHGDGSQAITWQHNTRSNTAAKNAAAWKKSSIGYFSLHDINSYPCEMGDEEKVRSASICIDNAHGQTVWNVHLEPWKTEKEFWQLYETRYSALLDKVRNYLKNQAERLREANLPPKAAIFFSAGFDASEWESAGMQRHKVNVPTEFYARIAQDVVKLAAEEGLHVDGRIISVLEGGYSDRALCSGILSHLSGLAGDQMSEQDSDNVGRLGGEMGQKLGTTSEDAPGDLEQKPVLDSIHAYDPSWWSPSRLDELEALMELPESPPPKLQNAPLPSYFAPTQASTAKVADPVKMRLSLSGLGASMARPQSPPIPEVPWAVATNELRKLLIPSGRQTDSCKPEELNAEASRVRRDRQSILMGIDPKPAPTPAPASRPTSRMSLRDRRAKPAPPEPSTEKAPTSRRRTMGAVTISSDKVNSSHDRSGSQLTSSKAEARGVPSRTNSDEPKVRRTSRRLSEIPMSLTSRDAPEASPIIEADVPAAIEHARTVPNSPARTNTVAGSSVQTKKARNPAPPRKEPAPRAPRGTKKTTTVAGSSRSTTAVQAISPPKSSNKDVASGTTGNDIDSITSGMRKIRINLITKSQKEAKERARQESEKAKKDTSVAPSQSAFEQPTGVSPGAQPSSKIIGHEPGSIVVLNEPHGISPTQPAPLDSRVPTPPTTTSSSSLVTPLQEQDPFESAELASDLVSPALSSPAIPSVSVHPSADADDIFVPYQPDGPAPEPVTRHEPLKWLPPNIPTPSTQTPTATPSPVKKNNLFRYTSGIPFAPRPGQQSQGGKAASNAKPDRAVPGSIDETPETHQH
ncbi:histone deacetylase HOS3 [Fusarium heterosporum]|uniref:Histone deacetylase HOS3 n=1 Tax=Fusarium heterosporum TaxID=42747 RepID=A0A8H5TMM8_FUSHE|nr:histone deacetylase HOS3 [Fusarium heterosporum]